MGISDATVAITHPYDDDDYDEEEDDDDDDIV